MIGKKTIIAIVTTLFLVWTIAITLPIIPLTNAAVNQTVLTKVNVSNTEPNVYNVTITPAVIALTPGTTTNVTCNATITDYNTVPSDIGSVNATLHHSTATIDGAKSNDTLYKATCANITSFSSTSALYSCDFNIWYFAKNGTWTCNITVFDLGHLNNTNSNTSIIQPLIALNVTDEIDYGIVPVLNTSGEKTANITNFGNIPINISIRGWGGDNETLYPNLSMVCELGNISIDMERYNITSGQAWTDMKNLTGTNSLINGFTVQIRNDTVNPKNITYWRIRIPTGVGGICNGTVLFTASNGQA